MFFVLEFQSTAALSIHPFILPSHFVLWLFATIFLTCGSAAAAAARAIMAASNDDDEEIESVAGRESQIPI